MQERQRHHNPAMIYPKNFEEKLNFGVIRSALFKSCQNEVGRYLAERMSYMPDSLELHRSLKQLDEMLRLSDTGVEIPSFFFSEIRASLLSIRPEGSYLPLESLTSLQQLLRSVVATVQMLGRDDDDEDDGNDYPELKLLVERLDDLPEVRRQLNNLLDDEGQIKDTASRLLREIRQEIRSLTGSLGNTMQSILKQAQAAGWVEKDAAPAMRDGRLLLPIIPSAKREIGGIVHEESATGRTLYIEPEQLVAMNNRIREKQNEENREIIRLLKEFTNYVRGNIKAIQTNCNIIGVFDFVWAKSRMAKQMTAIVPPLSEHREMDWQVARHPILERHLQDQGRQLVPLTVKLSPESRIIVISGPNAGGKSVALKTVGLLQYMLQCGMAVPMMEHSKCMLFDKIFLDIGDSQSLENDLSTYSSHLQSMKVMMNEATDESLILIDEFGSGTEPAIGGAIAEGLLEQFRQRGAYGFITTHYGNIKDYTEKHEGVINGAMLFDRGRIEPLYELYIGQPGSSFAIEIARKIGLPIEILDYAEALVGSEYMQQDKYLQDIIRDKAYWKRKRERIRRQEKALEEKQAKLDERLEALAERRKGILDKAEREALEIVTNANVTVERTIREIKQANADKEETKQARRKLEQKREHLEKIQFKKQAKSDRPKPKGKLEVGSKVTLEGSNEVGEIMEIDGKKARVQLGLLTMTVALNKLQPTNKEQRSPVKLQPRVIQQQSSERRLNFKPQIDLRGKRVNEALDEVVHFIDDAAHFGYSPVRILHGTGTGALKEAICQLLSVTPQVHSFHDELVDLGGAGITVVELSDK